MTDPTTQRHDAFGAILDRYATAYTVAGAMINRRVVVIGLNPNRQDELLMVEDSSTGQRWLEPGRCLQRMANQ